MKRQKDNWGLRIWDFGLRIENFPSPYLKSSSLSPLESAVRNPQSEILCCPLRLLKQNSTAQPLVFLMVLSSDHITGATGLTPTSNT